MEVVSLAIETLQGAAERAASYRLGQSVLRQLDRTLWVVEKCAKWAVPPPLDQDERPQPELVRPLPWVFFLVMLVALRVTRESISLLNLVMGKPPLRSADVVMYIQGKRRYLRTLKYQGNRIMRARCTPARTNDSWYSALHSLFEFTMCFRRHTLCANNNTTSHSNNDEVFVVKRSKRGRESVSPVVSNSESTMERLIEKMMVDLDADSDEDGSFTLTNVTSPKSDRSDLTLDSDQDTFQNNTRDEALQSQDKIPTSQNDRQVDHELPTAQESTKQPEEETQRPEKATQQPAEETQQPQEDLPVKEPSSTPKKSELSHDQDVKSPATSNKEGNSTPEENKNNAAVLSPDNPSTESPETSIKEAKSTPEEKKYNVAVPSPDNLNVKSSEKSIKEDNSTPEENKNNAVGLSPDNLNVLSPETSIKEAKSTPEDKKNNAPVLSPDNLNVESPETSIKNAKSTPEEKENNVGGLSPDNLNVESPETSINDAKSTPEEKKNNTVELIPDNSDSNEVGLKSPAKNNVAEEVHTPEPAVLSAKEESQKFLQMEGSSKIPRTPNNEPKIANGRTAKTSSGKKKGHGHDKDRRNPESTGRRNLSANNSM